MPVAVGVGGTAGVSVGANVALGDIVGLGVGATIAIAVGTSVAIGCSVGIGGAVAGTIGISARVGDGETTLGDGGDVGIDIGVGVPLFLTQPATTPAATIPEITAAATRNNPDVTPASSRRRCNQPLPQSTATSRAA